MNKPDIQAQIASVIKHELTHLSDADEDKCAEKIHTEYMKWFIQWLEGQRDSIKYLCTVQSVNVLENEIFSKKKRTPEHFADRIISTLKGELK